MTTLEWMLNEIRSQVISVRNQISGLPEEVKETIANECIDILKHTIEPEARPSLDKDGCVYWDSVLK